MADVRLFESREAILELGPLLAELAARCGQSGAMHWLPYFLSERKCRFKPPLLLLLLRQGTGALPLHPRNLLGAALFFEYSILGVRSGALSTDDAVGFRTVIAPSELRHVAASRAASALLERGAHLVLATYSSPSSPSRERGELPPATAPAPAWASRVRSVGRSLPLGPTPEDTLARLGKSTRFNLRYYRRRLARRLDCVFVPDAASELSRTELHDLNRGSLNPVEPHEFRARYESASTLPGSFLCGLRTTEGRWLSLIGGWRQGATTVLHWQSNSAGYEKDSIGTVMRSFFLEHESLRGTRQLMIFGGTPHTMRHSFAEDAIADLVVRRRTARAALLLLLARVVSSPRLTSRPNYFASTVTDRTLQWRVRATPGEGAFPPAAPEHAFE